MIDGKLKSKQTACTLLLMIVMKRIKIVSVSYWPTTRRHTVGATLDGVEMVVSPQPPCCPPWPEVDWPLLTPFHLTAPLCSHPPAAPHSIQPTTPLIDPSYARRTACPSACSACPVAPSPASHRSTCPSACPPSYPTACTAAGRTDMTGAVWGPL